MTINHLTTTSSLGLLKVAFTVQKTKIEERRKNETEKEKFKMRELFLKHALCYSGLFLDFLDPGIF